MNKNEAILAVQMHAECEYEGSLYYAYSFEYVHPTRKPTTARMGLMDKRANSVIYVPLEQVRVVRWNAPDDFVQEHLKKISVQI